MDPVFKRIVNDIVETSELAAPLALLLRSVDYDTADSKAVEIDVQQVREMRPLVVVNKPEVVIALASLYGTFDGGLGSGGGSCSSSPEQDGGSGELEKRSYTIPQTTRQSR